MTYEDRNMQKECHMFTNYCLLFIIENFLQKILCTSFTARDMITLNTKKSLATKNQL